MTHDRALKEAENLHQLLIACLDGAWRAGHGEPDEIYLSGAPGSPVPFSTDVQWRSLSEVYARRYQGERLKPQVGDDLRSLSLQAPLHVRFGDRWEKEFKTFGREPKDIFAPLDLLHPFIFGTFGIEENTTDFLRHSTPCAHGGRSLWGRPVEREQSPNL